MFPYLILHCLPSLKCQANRTNILLFSTNINDTAGSFTANQFRRFLLASLRVLQSGFSVGPTHCRPTPNTKTFSVAFPYRGNPFSGLLLLILFPLLPPPRVQLRSRLPTLLPPRLLLAHPSPCPLLLTPPGPAGPAPPLLAFPRLPPPTLPAFPCCRLAGSNLPGGLPMANALPVPDPYTWVVSASPCSRGSLSLFSALVVCTGRH